MGADDSNDQAGAAGECPGHEWVIKELDLSLSGARTLSECRWCGTPGYQPSQAELDERAGRRPKL